MEKAERSFQGKEPSDYLLVELCFAVIANLIQETNETKQKLLDEKCLFNGKQAGFMDVLSICLSQNPSIVNETILKQISSIINSYLEPLAKNPLIFVSHLKEHERMAEEEVPVFLKFLFYRHCALFMLTQNFQALEYALKGFKLMFEQNEQLCELMEETEDIAKREIL